MWVATMRLPGAASRRPLKEELVEVFHAARTARFYSSGLKATLDVSVGALAGCASGTELLSRLPVFRLDSGLVSRSAFESDKLAETAMPELFWPLPPPRRAAVLMPGFKGRPGLRVFAMEQVEDLKSFRPEALVGPLGRLRQLAEANLYRCKPAPELTHSVQVLVQFPLMEVSQEARELLWRCFKVPVFVQVLSWEGRLLAWECEAHTGYHVASENAVFELVGGDSGEEPELVVTARKDLSRPLLRVAAGWTAAVVETSCDCGHRGIKLLDVRRKVRMRAKQTACLAAASAGVASLGR